MAVGDALGEEEVSLVGGPGSGQHRLTPSPSPFPVLTLERGWGLKTESSQAQAAGFLAPCPTPPQQTTPE